jgi:hypothetical protein
VIHSKGHLIFSKEPRTILTDRHTHLSDDFWKSAKWVNTMHPSHSVNYHEGDIEKRTRLLRSITQACRNLRLADHVMLFTCITCGNLMSSLGRQLAESQRDTRWVEILIWALIELCFRPRHRLTNASLLTNGFYQLEDWHKNYFAHVLSLPSAKSNQAEKIAATIIPLFKRLNKCLKTNSWYLHAYEAN